MSQKRVAEKSKNETIAEWGGARFSDLLTEGLVG